MLRRIYLKAQRSAPLIPQATVRPGSHLSSLNSHLSTLISQLSALNSQLSTLKFQLSSLNSQLSGNQLVSPLGIEPRSTI